MEFDLAAIRYDLGDDAPEEVAASSIVGDLFQVLIQLASVLDFPVIFSPIDRNDVTIVCAFHESQ